MESRRSDERPVPRWRSLRWRLPLLASSLIAAIVAASLWLTSRELGRALLQAGGVRAVAAADQLSVMMTQGTTRGLTEVRRVAGDAALKALLEHPDSDSAAARRLLVPLAAAGQPPVELRRADGSLVLRATPQRGEPLQLDASVPLKDGLTPFFDAAGTAYYGVVAAITADEPSPPHTLGYLVVRRVLTTAQTTETLNRLVGGGAVVAIGHQTEGIWSNFSNVLAAPPVDRTRRGVSVYRAKDGELRIGALSVIAGTPWAAWIEFPEHRLLEPFYAVRRRMVALGLGFVIVAAAVVSLISARLTRPLQQMAEASVAIAAGEHSGRIDTDRHDEIGRLGAAFNRMAERVEASRRDLEARVSERTATLSEARAALERHLGDLKASNDELEAFTYSVSHDLRAPLRHVTGFASLLEKSAGDRLTDTEMRHLRTVVDAATRMGRLIDDLLTFSRMGRTPLAATRIQLDHLVADAVHEVGVGGPADHVQWQIHSLPEADADPAMLRLALINLLSNAVKYSAGRPQPTVEIGEDGSTARDVVIYVRDNGVGFDMQYAHKLFGVFQRLHSTDEFEGTGIGLANVRRIVSRHGGRVWAESAVDRGATFYIALPRSSDTHV